LQSFEDCRNNKTVARCGNSNDMTSMRCWKVFSAKIIKPLQSAELVEIVLV
jgi:hypothetical protein